MDVSDRVRDHFTALVRDLTPAGACGSVRMLYAPVVCDPEVSNLCASVLSASELRRMDRLADTNQRAEFSQRRAFRRYCASIALGSPQPLSEIVFEETEKGRPYLDDEPALWFSFSSCRSGMLGAWSSTHGVGVDIEEQNRDIDVLALARQFFSSCETSMLEKLGHTLQRRDFYRLWCLKEAALKSIGEGLPFGLDAFEFELYPAPRVIKSPAGHGKQDHFAIHEFAGDSMALVTRERRPGAEKRAIQA